MSKVLLASTSPYRKKLMEQAGFQFTTQAPLVDEEQLKQENKIPVRELPLFLAKEKAKSLVKDFPNHIIIGSDQVAIIEGQQLNKPKTKEEAKQRLTQLSGKTHELLTAVAIWHQNQWKTHIEEARMTMQSLSEEEINSYIDRDLPLGCAGGYKIESLGVGLFAEIHTKDYHSIIGLPMLAICQFFRDIKEFPFQS